MELEEKRGHGLPAEAGRRRGGQRGNQNARTHGFYSRKLLDEQKRDFEQALLITGLDEEIALMRVKLKALVETSPESVELIQKAVRTLARLITAGQNTRGDNAGAVQRAVCTVIRDVLLPLDGGTGKFLRPLPLKTQELSE